MKLATRSALALFGLMATAWSAAAADSLRGTGSLNDEKASFTHGVSTWKPATRELSLGAFTARAGATEKPYLVFDLTLKEGATTVSADTVQWCHIGFYGFKGSPLDHNTNAKSCGVELTGDPRTGAITGKLSGAYTFPAMGSFPAKATTWDLTVTTTPRASSAKVSSEVAVGPKATRLGPGGGAPGKAFLAEKCKALPASPLAALGMSNCKVLGGSEDAGFAVLQVEADTMGSRMRNDFVLAKEGNTWKVLREDAWRAAAP